MKRCTRQNQWVTILGLSLLNHSLLLGWSISPVQAQITPSKVESPAPANTAKIALPTPPTPAKLAAAPSGQYVLEFNRSPVVGNRLRMEGIYDETRLRFTRPRDWQPKAVKVQLRYRHSPALYATRSNLTVLINGTSIGSVALNKRMGEVGSIIFNVPLDIIQDYNEVVIAALQNNSPTCTQDPYDPSLWTEILPDSKLVFDVQPQSVPLDLSQYPYPLFDRLALEPNQVAYLQPKAMDQPWLTGVARFQTMLGRVAEYRPLDNRLVKSVDEIRQGERLVIVGTPENQPALASLKLPMPMQNGKLLDGKKAPLPNDVGVLMLATTRGDRNLVFVASGNSPTGVAKAVQFLVQGGDRRIGTGQVVLVDQLNEVPSPDPRDWSGYLPREDAFQLKDLQTYDQKPYGDVTVRGSNSPALQFDFRALPDDQFNPGNTMTLRYSYGPQINPLTSQVEVQIDGVTVAGNRLTSIEGAKHQSLQVSLPENLITPNSRMQVNFRLDPRERRSCSRVTDQQLWGTIHADTSFQLSRDQVAHIPDLKLLRNGYPFTAPQDLSTTTMVLPEQPTPADVNLLLEVAERLGKLSRADSVQLEVYTSPNVPSEVRDRQHLIAIGTQTKFPLPEAFKTTGFSLQNAFTRRWQAAQVQTLPDQEGVIQQIISPWNRDRVLLALTAQTEKGLQQIQDFFSQDPLFSQLQGDTVLISAAEPNPDPYDPNDYNLEFLQQSPQQEVTAIDWTLQLTRLLRNHWFILAPAMIVASLVLYGVAQLYLKRSIPQERS